MIKKKGYYKDSDNKVWYWDGWSNQPIVTLVSVQDEEIGFYRDGNSIGSKNSTIIIKYLSETEYPEFYI
jgi:hypothetical protein